MIRSFFASIHLYLTFKLLSTRYLLEIIKGRQAEFFWLQVERYANEFNRSDGVFLADSRFLYDYYFLKPHVARFAFNSDDRVYAALRDYISTSGEHYDFFMRGEDIKAQHCEPVILLKKAFEKLYRLKPN